MVLSYPASYHRITDEMRGFFPANRLARFKEFYASRVEDSRFIDALCVDVQYRRCGIAEKLITMNRERAAEKGFRTLSLMVFADNDVALSFYANMGFEAVGKIRLDGNEIIQHQGGCILMKTKDVG